METVGDFEDILLLLDKHRVRYLIVGGLAFIYHAKPKYTKDMDLWVDASGKNLDRANKALAEFGSPVLFEKGDEQQILQVGIAPDRIDLILRLPGVEFREAWPDRIEGRYGEARANWIDLDNLIRNKESIDDPRHQSDARTLRKVRDAKK